MNIRSRLFYAYILLVIIYAATVLIFVPDGVAQRYDLSPLEYRLLTLTIVVPLSLIWFAAFYGYGKLRAYTKLIRSTADGRHTSQIAHGIMVLAFGLPISTIASTISNRLSESSPALASAAIITENYLSLLIPLIAFSFISVGARGLSDLAKQRPSQRAINILAGLFIAIGVMYCYVALTSGDLQGVYHLPDWLIVSTIIGPYLYVWYLGLLSAYEIYLYSQTAPGLLYRRTWGMLAKGIAAILLMSIVVQYTVTLTTQFASMRLRSLLIIVYVLLALLSVGYVLVAIGARRLRKIEEV
jgi:hypothetical protein